MLESKSMTRNPTRFVPDSFGNDTLFQSYPISLHIVDFVVLVEFRLKPSGFSGLTKAEMKTDKKDIEKKVSYLVSYALLQLRK